MQLSKVSRNICLMMKSTKSLLTPYGQSKLQNEEIFRDLDAPNPDWKIVSLRYFNSVSVHEYGLISEDSNGVSNNLMPYVAEVASGVLPHLNNLGGSYETRDGTGGDYIHVMDLAEGHKAPLFFLRNHMGWNYLKICAGKPTSVIGLLNVFEKIIRKKLNTIIENRQLGGLPCFYVIIKQVQIKRDWSVTRSIEEVCTNVWKFQKGSNFP